MIWNCPGRSSAAEFRSVVPARCWSTGKKSDPVSHPFRRRLVKRLQRSKDSQSVGLSKRVFPERTPLCGFCQNGMMIKATELLERNASPSVAEIKEAFTTSGPSAHLCRCGSYTAILEAV